MLHTEPNERRQRSIVLGDRALHLDFAEWDEQAPLELRVEGEYAGGTVEVAGGGDQGVHG